MGNFKETVEICVSGRKENHLRNWNSEGLV